MYTKITLFFFLCTVCIKQYETIKGTDEQTSNVFWLTVKCMWRLFDTCTFILYVADCVRGAWYSISLYGFNVLSTNTTQPILMTWK